MFVNAPLGHVARLWRYPIKSLAAEALAHADVVESGVAGDRGTALFVATQDLARTGKPYRGKEHARLHTVATTREADVLARERDLALERHDAGPYFDLDPISILFDTWLADVARALGTDFDPLRFRPNIFVTAAGDFLEAESALVDRIVRIGAVRLKITQTITRCVTPSYDVATGDADPRLLAHLTRARDNTMGVYASVVRTGRISPGDAVEFADAR